MTSKQAVPADLAMSQMIVDNIPQLQAHVRQQAEMKHHMHHQLQMQLAQQDIVRHAIACSGK
jgi:hypothetical protein